MAESKKVRFFEYFNRNKKRVLNMLKKHGQFISFSNEHGYLYSVEIGAMAGSTVLMHVALKAGEITIIDILTA